MSTAASDKPRLIEVAFPLKQASLASVHEKNVRHGHISTLHVWPARRPLAASRAALLATLLPDPGDAEKRKALLDKIGGTVSTKTVKDTDADGNTFEETKEVVTGGVLVWGQENAPEMKEFRHLIREACGGHAPKVIDPFAGGGAIPLEAMRLGCEVTAADINPVAWFIQKCTLEYSQRFAGKKWPLPDFVKEWPDFIEDFRTGKVKKRSGSKKPHFSDPQQTNFLELPTADLTWHVRAWGRWVRERARQDLAARYPTINGEPTVAYLWARTARDKQTAGQIPLLKTFWICKKAGRRVALLPLPREDKKGVRYHLLTEDALKQPAKVVEEHAILQQWEVTPEKLTEFLNKGTMNRAGVWSPVSGRPGMISLTMADLRRQGQQGLQGSEMTSVIVEGKMPGGNRFVKKYRLPIQQELDAATVDPECLQAAFEGIPFGMIDEQLPQGGGSGAGRAFSVPKYGFKKWREVFSPRQLVALATFVRHIREAGKLLIEKDEIQGQAILAGLVCGFDRMLDFNSTLLSWILSVEAIGHTFARFALPMTWDFAEAAMINDCRGGWGMCLDATMEALATAMGAGGEGTITPRIVRENAVHQSQEKMDLVLTDPPYYDAIPYADLMDFFYVWDRRLMHGLMPEASMFEADGAPKWDSEKGEGELIEDESRHGGNKEAAKRAYEEGMGKAFAQSLASLNDDGRLVVVFANKEVAAWETLVAALIRGGAVVTGSWPIQTEQSARMRAQSSAALASSVWIVCRKRSKTAQAGWEENVFDAMRRTLFEPRDALGGRNILQYYFDLGIRGPDFLWAALGPALEAYSAHPFVKKTAGGMLTVPEFLSEVRRLVLHFALGELPGFKEISQQTQGRGESLEIDSVTQYYLLHRAYFGLEAAPAGACIMYAQACGRSESELKMVWHVIEQGGKSKAGRPKSEELEDVADDAGGESKGNEFRLVPWEERAQREELGETRGGLPAPLIDRLQRLMRLFQQNRTAEVQQLYDAWGLANDRAFSPLLQAVRELALNDRQDIERRLVEALATQLKLNRKQVMVEEVVDNQMKMRVMETEVFAPIEEMRQQPVTYRATGKKRSKA